MIQINDLLQLLGLGELTLEPTPVTGGLLHRMYRVTTTEGIFAVKKLNEEIMKRPAALQNTIYSEKIAAEFASCVPVVAALEIQEKQIHEIDGQYFMLFPWVEGESVFPPKLTEKHCEAMGDILGKMHSRNVSVEGVVPQEDNAEPYAWEDYLNLAESQGLQQSSWYVAYKDALADVMCFNKAACEAQHCLAKKQVISHRDLDPKNVMWQGEKPFVIDWEAAGYVNPQQELLEVINYWADDGKGGLQKGHLKTIIQAYKKHMSLENIDWGPVFAGSFSGMLGWLEYNVKRALGMETSSEDDIRAGEEQVSGTITELYAYQRKLEEIKEFI